MIIQRLKLSKDRAEDHIGPILKSSASIDRQSTNLPYVSVDLNTYARVCSQKIPAKLHCIQFYLSIWLIFTTYIVASRQVPEHVRYEGVFVNFYISVHLGLI